MLNRENSRSYKYLIQWLIIAIIAGVVGSLFIDIFTMVINRMTDYLSSLDSVPRIVWPVSSALILGFFIYRLEPRAKGEGMPSYIVGLNENFGRLPISETFYKLIASLLTLGTFGNGGYLGPGGRVSAGILSALNRLIPAKIIPKEHTALFPICGLAAAFASMIHSPIGAGIFAVEIIQKSSMRYRHLFPAILAAEVSVYMSRIFGFAPVFTVNASQSLVDIRLAGILILVSIVSGFLGRAFTMLYALVSRLFHRDKNLSQTGLALRAVIGSGLAFAAAYFLNPELIGTSREIFKAVLSGNETLLYGNLNTSMPLYLVLALLIIAKALANSLTVGSGMSAGFAGPAIIIGMLAGAAFADIFGILPGTAEYFALLAAGFAGVFSSTMNTPIAVSVIIMELFGMHYGLPAGLGAVIGFQVNRQHTLYDMVFEEEDDY